VRRQGDEGVDAVRLVGMDGDPFDRFEVVADPLESAPEFFRPFLGAGNQDEIASEGDEAFAKAGGVEWIGDRITGCWLLVTECWLPEMGNGE
jgi:hypothetical protein